MTNANVALKMHIVDCAVDGVFNNGYLDVARELGYKSASMARYEMQKLVDEGFIEIKDKGKRGRGSTSSYRLMSGNLIRIDFMGENLMLRKVEELGWTMSATDIAKATLENKDTLFKIMNSNKEQFEPNTIEIDGETYLNKTSVLIFLMKLNLDNAMQIKKNYLQEYQLQCVSLLSKSVLHANVHLTPDQQIEISTNLSRLTDLSKDDVLKLLSGIEAKVNNLISIQSDQIKKLSEDKKMLGNKLNLCDSKLKSYESQVVELKQQVMDLRH